MNFWKQSNHVMSYFKEENFRAEKRLPTSFMSGFLEVGKPVVSRNDPVLTLSTTRVATESERGRIESLVNTEYKSLSQYGSSSSPCP